MTYEGVPLQSLQFEEREGKSQIDPEAVSALFFVKAESLSYHLTPKVKPPPHGFTFLFTRQSFSKRMCTKRQWVSDVQKTNNFITNLKGNLH